MIAEIAMAGFLVYKDMNPTKTNLNICIKGGSCESVQNSVYGSIFGIKLPVYGLIAFIILLGLYFLNKKLHLLTALIGMGISLTLISIQVFVLKQICSNCMIVDFTMITIFLISLVNYFIFKKK